MKKICKIVVFLSVLVFLFAFIQEIFIPDSSRGRSNADKIINGLYALEDDSLDVLFLGASHMGCGISPLMVYEDTGICSYVLSTDGQPIDASYYLLKDTFTSQSPVVVVLDVSALFHEDDKESCIRWRHVLDNYGLCRLKYEMAKSYDELKYSEGIETVLFPILKYHDRWAELNESDFSSIWKKYGEYYLLGGRREVAVNGDSHATVREINSVAQILQQDSYITYIENGVRNGNIISTQLYAPKISERNLDYLLKIEQLCEVNNAQLILTKIPVLKYIQYYSSAWTEQKSQIVKNIAVNQGIPFLDLMYDVDIGLDWTQDSCDSGFHLNIKGAEKVTKKVEEYLLNYIPANQLNNPQYNKYLAAYKTAHEAIMLETETNFHNYVKRLKTNQEKLTILISASEEYMLNMDEEGYNLMTELGLQLIRDGAFRDAYVAVLEGNNLLYEAVSGRRIDHSCETDHYQIRVGSAGWNVGTYCMLSVNGKNYAQGGRGLNFVICDNATGQVIDSVSFDASLPPQAATRNSSLINSLIIAYEEKLYK